MIEVLVVIISVVELSAAVVRAVVMDVVESIEEVT